MAIFLKWHHHQLVGGITCSKSSQRGRRDRGTNRQSIYFNVFFGLWPQRRRRQQQTATIHLEMCVHLGKHF